MAGAIAGSRVRKPGEWDWDEMRAAARREARRYLLASHDIDDVVQEALMRAWRRRESCRDDELPWMRQIARNEALRLIDRRRIRAERELLDDERVLSAVPDQGAEEEWTDLLLRLDLSRVLRRFSIDDRRLLALRYVRDLSQPEVARVLGIPEGTVKVRLHRLRGRLRKELETSR